MSMKNKPFKTGAVLGKFYPLHKGHQYLIESGMAQCEKFNIIIAAKPTEFITGDQRAKWAKKLYPKARVLILRYDDSIPAIDHDLWANMTIDILGYKPDVVFGSEKYGEPWAERMGCEHVMVDIDRKTIPISGTMIRENPYKYWEYMDPIVRSFFVKRITVLGAESTGTTTLAKDLAKHYKTAWVPEYGRYYYEGRMHLENSSEWSAEEFEFIAKQQNKWEDKLATKANKVLICDTDSFATSLWHERYRKKQSQLVEKTMQNRAYDLYILTSPDIPFEQDGTRDGEHIREWMHSRFVEKLEQHNKNFIIVKGNREKRLDKAITAINKVFDSYKDSPAIVKNKTRR